MTPRIIHQIWIGTSVMPADCRQWCHSFERMNPAWEYHLWGQDALERYADDPYLKFFAETGEKLAFVADRIRVLLLRDFGGIYLDVDCKPIRTLGDLDRIVDDPEVDFLCGMRSPDRKMVHLHRGISLIDNTVFGSAKNGRMANRLCALYKPDSKKHTGYSQGLEVIRNMDQTVRVLNYRYFYAETIFPETILLHDSVNLGSWVKKPQPMNV